APPEPFIPEPLRGRPAVAVAACHAGALEEGLETLRPLKDLAPAADLLGPIPYTALQGMFDASAPHGIHAYFKNQYADELSDQAIAIVLEHAAALPRLSPFAALHVHHVQGAVDRVDAAATAFGGRGHRYVLNLLGLWQPPADPDAHIGWVRDFWTALRPVTASAPYLNFLADEGQERVRAAYGEDHYRRLVALKDRYDPSNVFRLNQNVRPSAEEAG
ncbi:MAG TPA: BBE domain-containing protein, partial [Actinomycetes bacterium]|nr:BBE domain-containing protein [Actinomycetes bacterium]